MHAMQYEITLPGDYDMGIIRRRVAGRGAATDAFSGLGLKAYAIRASWGSTGRWATSTPGSTSGPRLPG